MSKIITVFGATGAQGGGLSRAILADPQHRFALRAVTRKPDSPAARALARAGADVVVADLDDIHGVRRAMAGAHGAFCVTSFWEHLSPDRELAQARTLAQAARDAGLQHVVWSTLEDTRQYLRPGTRMPLLLGRYNVPHYDAKGEANAAFFERGVPTTLLHTSLGFVLPMGDARLPGIAAADIGPCAFAIFVRGAEMIGKSVGIAGEHLTGAQMAEQLSLALDEPVSHIALAPAQYAALGFPGAEDLANMFQFKHEFERMYCDSRSVACTRELYPAVQTFAHWLAAHAARIPLERRAA